MIRVVQFIFGSPSFWPVFLTSSAFRPRFFGPYPQPASPLGAFWSFFGYIDIANTNVPPTVYNNVAATTSAESPLQVNL